MGSKARRQECLRPKTSWLDGSSGQGLAEYLIIVVVVACVVILGIRYFGGTVFGKFENATQEISSAKDKQPGQSSAPGSGEPSQSAPQGASGPSSFKGAVNDSGSSSLQNSSQMDALRPPGVGDKDVLEPPRLAFDARTLAILGLVVILVGFGIVLATGKKRDKKGKKKKKVKLVESEDGGNESGQAMAEFVIVAITFLFCILGVIQLALTLNAYSLVRYAAYNAARAGVVHGADHEKMLEAARLSLIATFPKHGRADHVRGFAENYLAARATDQIDDVGEGPITDVKVLNNNGLPSGETVTFDDPGGKAPQTITVQVTHRYELVIPLVNRILYYIHRRFVQGVGYGNESLDYLSAETNRLRQSGQSLHDIEYRIPLVAHYTMRMQSDYVVE